MPDRHEFAGPGWVDEVRAVVLAALDSHDLTGVRYSFSEEFTDPPEHLRRHGAATIGWHLRIADGVVEVGDTPIDDADLRFVADYQAVLPLAQTVFEGHPEPAKVEQLLQDLLRTGKVREEGDRSRVPSCVAALNLHDAMAVRTH